MLANALYYGSIPLFVGYFYFFRRTIQQLPPTERTRFITDAALPGWRRVLALAPIPLMLIVSGAGSRMILALWFLVQLFLDTRLHQRKLAALGFDPHFQRQLRGVSLLGAGVVLMFAAGLILQGRTN